VIGVDRDAASSLLSIRFAMWGLTVVAAATNLQDKRDNDMNRRFATTTIDARRSSVTPALVFLRGFSGMQRWNAIGAALHHHSPGEGCGGPS
jgi:hypothetical protein